MEKSSIIQWHSFRPSWSKKISKATKSPEMLDMGLQSYALTPGWTQSLITQSVLAAFANFTKTLPGFDTTTTVLPASLFTTYFPASSTFYASCAMLLLARSSYS